MGFSAIKKCFCFHSQSDDPPLLAETENRPPPSTSTRTTTRSVAEVEVQQEEKIEIHVKNEGEIEEVRIYKVPLKYLSYTTFRALMERSGEDLNNISGGQKINISCKFELFEMISKFVKWKELEAKCEEESIYDDRLWRRW